MRLNNMTQSTQPTRRQLLIGLGSTALVFAIASPAIVRASSLMPIKSWRDTVTTNYKYTQIPNFMIQSRIADEQAMEYIIGLRKHLDSFIVEGDTIVINDKYFDVLEKVKVTKGHVIPNLSLEIRVRSSVRGSLTDYEWDATRD